MKSIDELLRQLARPEVQEVALGSDRLPCVKVGPAFQPVAKVASSTDDVKEMLAEIGALDRLGKFSAEPTVWSFEVKDLGTVEASVITRGDGLLARFVLGRREIVGRDVPDSSDFRRASSEAVAVRTIDGEDDEEELTMINGRPASERRASEPSVPALEEEASPQTSRQRSTIPPEVRPAVDSKLDALLARARELGASDLHLVADAGPLFRVHGELTTRDDARLDAATIEKIAQSLAPMRAHAAIEFDGESTFVYADRAHGSFRVNLTREASGLKAILHAVPREVPSVASLEVPEALVQATRSGAGIVLVASARGGGKSSTLAALIDRLNEETRAHVVTFERAIEIAHPQKQSVISQRELGTHTRTLAAAWRAARHEDADVVVFTDVRDVDAAEAVIASCERGQLVLASIDATRAFAAIERLLALVRSPYVAHARSVLAHGLKMVAAQRLVRTKEGPRVAAFETLAPSPAIATAIRDGAALSTRLRGSANGSVRLEDALAALVRSGRVSIEDAHAAGDGADEIDAAIARSEGKPALERAKAIASDEDERNAVLFESALNLSGPLARSPAMTRPNAATSKRGG